MESKALTHENVEQNQEMATVKISFSRLESGHKIDTLFHPPVVNTERETNVRYASKYFPCERYSIFRDAHLLSHFAGEIKSAISKVESLATGSDSFSVLVKLIEEEASVI